jgi:hypothetical protein
MATWLDDCEATGIVTAISEWKLVLEPIKRVPRLFLHAKRAISTCVHACETLYKYYNLDTKVTHPLFLSLYDCDSSIYYKPLQPWNPR